MTRTILIAVAVAALAMPLLAQEAAAPPKFFIERIEVRNASRVSPDVVIAESRLREGREYSEEELRDASTRLSRLPFLLAVDFSLEKGGERGNHVLIISITETKNFFYALDIRPIFKNDFDTDADYSDRVSGSDSEATVGMRFFVGRRGAIHFGLFGQTFNSDFLRDYSALAVGYTQYDLFGTRAFATLNLKRIFDGYAEGEESFVSPQLVVGIPLSPNQTLTVAVDEGRFGGRRRIIGDETFESRFGQRVVTTAWTYNTTNHPFLPTRGTLLQVKPMVSWSDSVSFHGVAFDNPPRFEVRRIANHTFGQTVELASARYWEISDRNSVSAGVQGGVSRFELRRSNQEDLVDSGGFITLQGGVSRSLWDPNRGRDGDSRVELNVRIRRNSGIGFERNPFEDFTEQISASWVRRSSWGTLRLGAGYAW